jgi:hypothetical protein
VATPHEAAVIAQVAATLLAGPKDSAALSVAGSTVESAVNIATEIYKLAAAVQVSPKR